MITGRRTGDFAGYWGGDPHDGVPIFVPTHQPRADNPYELVHFVSDGLEECVSAPKAAAGGKDVLFDGLPASHIELDLVRTLEAPGVLHLRYEVRR